MNSILLYAEFQAQTHLNSLKMQYLHGEAAFFKHRYIALKGIRSFFEKDEIDLTATIHNFFLNKVILFFSLVLISRWMKLYLDWRAKDKKKKSNSLIPLMAPAAIYLLTRYLLSRTIAEISACGVLCGILTCVQSYSGGNEALEGIKFQVHSPKSDQNCVIETENVKITLGEVRDKIAAALNITPSSRVCLESGKGSFLDKLTQPILPTLPSSSVSTDASGTVLVSLKIAVLEASSVKEINGVQVTEKEEAPTSFFDMLNSQEHIRYGMELTLHARVKSSAVDLVIFSISPVNGFAAASPSSPDILGKQLFNSSSPIILRPWDASSAGHLSRAESVSSLNESDRRLPPGSSHRSSLRLSSGNEPSTSMVSFATTPRGSKAAERFVKDKEEVMIESNGKFLSVAKGWWMSWSSDTPRRSGAFVIEITERASTSNHWLNKLGKSFKGSPFGRKDSGVENGTTSGGAKDAKDTTLRAGDSFRLRSVKFPDYELGVTSVKIHDNFCYLGLRKV